MQLCVHHILTYFIISFFKHFLWSAKLGICWKILQCLVNMFCKGLLLVGSADLLEATRISEFPLGITKTKGICDQRPNPATPGELAEEDVAYKISSNAAVSVNTAELFRGMPNSRPRRPRSRYAPLLTKKLISLRWISTGFLNFVHVSPRSGHAVGSIHRLQRRGRWAVCTRNWW